jgi:hypothetical protein
LIRYYGVNVKGDDFVRLAFEIAAAYASVKVMRQIGGGGRGGGVVEEGILSGISNSVFKIRLMVDSDAIEDCD